MEAQKITHRIEFVPNPVQKMFIESRARADLFSSRVGEGKSAALAWSVYFHTVHNPGANWVVIRDTWENIRATTLKEFFKWFQPGMMGTWHEGKKTWTWAEGVAQGTIEFMGMDDPGDASKLQSRELAGIAVDEPAPAASSGGVSELVFDIGMSRLRQPNMNWYAVKLAENNPDESHWTYKKFVDPGSDNFKVWQPLIPENEKNLPSGYYAGLRQDWQHRPDLVRRFVEGKFGFQQEGKIVTPEWSDDLHLATGLFPLKNVELVMLWDFGHNPTCIITQITPLRHWNVLDAIVGEDMGVEELIVAAVKPLLQMRYPGFKWRHIGDPAGRTLEQSSIQVSAVRVLKKALGGNFRPGPEKNRIHERVEPLRAVLRQTVRGGRGLLQVDRVYAKPVWYALRGGWHYHVARTGIVGDKPAKDIHSHPGDAMGYGSAILFPLARLQGGPSGKRRPDHAIFWGVQDRRPQLVVPGRGVPPEGRVIGVG